MQSSRKSSNQAKWESDAVRMLEVKHRSKASPFHGGHTHSSTHRIKDGSSKWSSAFLTILRKQTEGQIIGQLDQLAKI
jgi:hypothetical protein